MTDAPEPPSDAALRDSASVLYEVFGLKRFADTAYLRWFYVDNPVGPAIVVRRFATADPAACVAHMAGIPQTFHRVANGKSETLPFVFPLNIAVSETARGQGLMTKMSHECFDRGAARYGDGGMVGMPNEASTPGYTKKLGFRLVRPLPVRAVVPWSFERVESHPATPHLLETGDFAHHVEQLDLSPTGGWSQRWTPDLLRWRLSTPGARYVFHRGRAGAIVTTVDDRFRFPVTVVLKTFARLGHRGALLDSLIAGACRFHRSPIAVYAGFNRATRVGGVPVPKRLKPAPLNLIVRSLQPGFFDEQSFVYDAMEFFDFDAY